jgi:Zn-dependent peptidase ImmA (M78 family)/DNA-binding XRE family transcriptional regulator
MLSLRIMDERAELTSLAHHLRRLRRKQGLTQAELADQADLSRLAYRNIEAGEASPKVETLLRIAQVLEVRLEELLAPIEVLRQVRFRATKRMNTREEILIDVGRWLRDYAELEELLHERRPFSLDKIQVAGADRAREAAGLARRKLGLRGDEPVRDLCGLLEAHGVKVLPLPLASDGFFGLSVGRDEGGPAIVVNVWERISVERWIFTAAHELGHLILHLDAYDVSRSNEDDDEEQEANRFASQLLMPEAGFEREWNGARGLGLFDRVMKVKRAFRVSYRTVLYRLAEAAPEEDLWRRFQHEHKRRTGRTLTRSDEPEAISVEAHAAAEPVRLEAAEFVEERLSGLVRAAVEKELISVGRAAEILGIDQKAMRERIASWA